MSEELESRLAVLEARQEAMDTRDESINVKLDKILEQTTKHNGRLGRVEMDVKDVNLTNKEQDKRLGKLENKLAYFMGICVVVVFIIDTIKDKVL